MDTMLSGLIQQEFPAKGTTTEIVSRRAPMSGGFAATLLNHTLQQ